MTTKPLEGIRIADFTWVWAGPSGTELLAYLGAEVIKIESEARLDSTRRTSFRGLLEPPPINQNINFNSLNLGKRGITLDLTNPRGKELLFQLLAKCDILAHNFSGGAMERMGLSYPEVTKVNPNIIYVGMSGFGNSGPMKLYRGYDPIFGALSGFTDLLGYPDSLPCRVAPSMLDMTNGVAMAFAAIAALEYRAKTGQGQFVDLSQWEMVDCILGDAFMDYFMNGRPARRAGNWDKYWSPHNCYRCKGVDKWVSIAVTSEDEWQAFCKVVGKPEWISDERFSKAFNRLQNQQELDKLIGEWTVNYTDYEATEILQKAGIAAFPSMSQEEIAHDRHLNERGLFVEVDHPEVGKRTYLGPPWKLSATPAELAKHAPMLGEDNEYVFCELLGLSIEEFAMLIAENIIR
jgi:benzylsuccinate CoA-transferase BbsF subunit